jgi:hypothetical protein
VEKPPFFMHPHDKRYVVHINYFSAAVGVSHLFVHTRAWIAVEMHIMQVDTVGKGSTLLFNQLLIFGKHNIIAQVDPVYFPQLEVVGDIGNAIWQLKEHIKGPPPAWDLRLASSMWLLFCSFSPLLDLQ